MRGQLTQKGKGRIYDVAPEWRRENNIRIERNRRMRKKNNKER